MKNKAFQICCLCNDNPVESGLGWFSAICRPCKDIAEARLNYQSQTKGNHLWLQENPFPAMPPASHQ
jgi:hypothetical protein